MVALFIRQAEVSLFENWILSIPQRQRKTKQLFLIAEPSDAILSPAIGSTACFVMGEIIPRGAICRIIFSHSSPLSVWQEWTEVSPLCSTCMKIGDPRLFGVRWCGIFFRSYCHIFTRVDRSIMNSRYLLVLSCWRASIPSVQATQRRSKLVRSIPAVGVVHRR